MIDTKIIQDKDNSLLNRKEIKILVGGEITPSKNEAEKILSKKFSKPVENIALKRVKGKFGRDTFLIEANIYSSEEDKNKTEPKPKKKKEKK